jgi:hypothetical protein
MIRIIEKRWFIFWHLLKMIKKPVENSLETTENSEKEIM